MGRNLQKLPRITDFVPKPAVDPLFFTSNTYVLFESVKVQHQSAPRNTEMTSPACQHICQIIDEAVKNRDTSEEAKDITWDTAQIKEAVTRYYREQTEKSSKTDTTPSKAEKKEEKRKEKTTEEFFTMEKLDELINTVKQTQDKTLALPNFEGKKEDDIQEHINMFEKLCTLNDWDGKTKIKNYTKLLKGNALEYFMNEVLQANQEPNWTAIKNTLTAKYKRDEDDWELIISQSKQTESEDPELYAIKIQKLCKKMNPTIS